MAILPKPLRRTGHTQKPLLPALPIPAQDGTLGRQEGRLNAAEWKRERMIELRARIRIEEAVLRSLRAELEEFQWLNRRATELRYGWDVVLAEEEEEQDRRLAQQLWEDLWLAGEHNLKRKSTAA